MADVKTILGGIVQWIAKLVVAIVKKKSKDQLDKELKEHELKTKKEIAEKEIIVRKKYDDLRRNNPSGWNT